MKEIQLIKVCLKAFAAADVTAGGRGQRREDGGGLEVINIYLVGVYLNKHRVKVAAACAFKSKLIIRRETRVSLQRWRKTNVTFCFTH